jgi:hypothetical protein
MFSCFSFLSSEEHLDDTFKRAMTASFQIITNLSYLSPIQGYIIFAMEKCR